MSIAKRRTKIAKTLEAGPLEPAITSFELHLQAEGKSPKTRRTYIDAARWFAGDHLLSTADKDDWETVEADDIRRWMVRLLDRYSDTYANNQFRALQQFFKWWAHEEELPNPMLGMKPPKIDEKIVPIFTDDELHKLEATCVGRTFQARRDAAVISFLHATGCRLSELAHIELDDLDLRNREAVVTGKGGKQRTVRFGHDTARTLDRYIRQRAKHSHAESSRLWLGIRNRPPMTPNGIYQMIKRRGDESGVAVYPHKFRHQFSHEWLDRGGPEGDLMELNGWSSPAMLRRYGASARSARARRSYDRIMSADS